MHYCIACNNYDDSLVRNWLFMMFMTMQLCISAKQAYAQLAVSCTEKIDPAVLITCVASDVMNQFIDLGYFLPEKLGHSE